MYIDPVYLLAYTGSISKTEFRNNIDRKVHALFSSYSKIVETLNLVKDLHIGENEEGKPLLNNVFRKKRIKRNIIYYINILMLIIIRHGFILTMTIGGG